MRATLRLPSVSLLSLLPLLLTGCLDDLPQPSKITGLRVLGIRASPPEVAEGQVTTLSALVVDSEGRDIKLTWLACLKGERGAGFFGGGSSVGSSGGDGYSLTDPGTCFDLKAALATEPALGLPPPGLLELCSDTEVRLQIPTGITSNPDVVQGAYGISGATLPPEALAVLTTIAGVNLTVALRAEVDGDVLESFKRVNVSTAPVRNDNPSGLLFHLSKEESPEDDDELVPKTGDPSRRGRCFGAAEDTEPLTIYDGTWVIRAQNIPEVPVTYPVILGSTDPDSPFSIQDKDEVLFYSVFSSDGDLGDNVFKSRGQAKTTWELPSDMPETVTLFIVVRDGRGGASWCQSDLRRVPAPE